MSEVQTAAETAAPPAIAQQPGINVQQAAALLKERREGTPKNEASEAARILGQHAAKAREERRAEAARQAQEAEAKPADAGEHVEDDQTPTGEAQDEVDTASADTPDDTQAETQDDPDSGTIDLGEGVRMTKEEVRENIMLKADHTKRLMALAEERKAFEAKSSQALSQLDKLIASLEPMTGDNKPKSRRDFIQEYGVEEGLDKYEDHMRRVDAAKRLAQHTRQKAEADKRLQAEKECDEYLVANHKKEWAVPEKYEAAQVAITKHAKALGFTNEQIHALGVIPGALIALDESRELRELKANKGAVTKLIDKPKVVKPGVKTSAAAGKHSSIQNARASLKSSGSLADAVALLKAKRG